MIIRVLSVSRMYSVVAVLAGPGGAEPYISHLKVHPEFMVVRPSRFDSAKNAADDCTSAGNGPVS